MLFSQFSDHGLSINLLAIHQTQIYKPFGILMAVGWHTVRYMLLRTFAKQYLVLTESFNSQLTGKHFTLMSLPREDIIIH